MFLKSSRYSGQKLVDAMLQKGRTVKAVMLRRLPRPPGSCNPMVVKMNDRLDIIAQRQYNNPTMFWHVADANTELEANELVEETGRVIKVPEQ